MKTLLVTLVTLFALSHSSIGRSFNDREMTKGTLLNYTVKEGTLSYKVKLTIVQWDEAGDIKLQWQSSGGKISKGTCTLPADALETASIMKVKLKAGDEKLSYDISRWFLSYDNYDFLYNMGIETDMKIDDKDVTLYPNEDITEKEVLYNNVKTKMDYAEGVNSTDKITMGFIEYAEKVYILDKYENGNFSMNLVSIVSPQKPEDKLAKEILDAMAPKGKVKVKKMEPAKFAVVKSKYPLLARIEDYDATKGGTISKPITETYEYRYGTNSPNPPSLIDCFTADLKIIYNQRNSLGIADMTETIGTKSLRLAAAKILMGVYLTKEYDNIPGYRPWTNWSFVRSLSEIQREQLALELQGYIEKYGFTE